MFRFRGLSLALILFFVGAVFFGQASMRAADPTKALAPRYRHWINEEVPYIIGSSERNQFLSLKSDPERENFIKAFWDARNPNPRSEANTYKEEHYRRLAYANEHYGSTELQDGWRSDQGHIYITLGAPQQITTYPNSRNVRPIIIWFYQSPTSALPTHFNVLFYKRSAGDPYTLYSPYQDGPSRLTTGLEDLNVQSRSIQTIRKSLGDEVARTTLSLIPTEPVDLNNYQPSMQSDVLLSTIKGLAENEVTRELLEAHRSHEVVSSRILMSSTQAEIQPISFRESGGRQTVFYLFVPHEPIRNLIGPLPDGKLGYNLTLQTTITTKSGTRVYGSETGLQGSMTQEEATTARAKRFAAEERLPLAPGDYKITSTLTNTLTHIALQESQTLIVPDLSKETWNISNLLAFAQPSGGKAIDKLPFSIAGVRFNPRAIGDISLHPSEPLWVAFQLWAKPPSPATLAATASGLKTRRIKLIYSYGNLQSGLTPQTETEEIDAADVDPSGNLLTGHKIDTTKLDPGTYRLIVTALDEDSQQKTFASMSFRIVPWAESTDMWTAYFIGGSGKRSDAMDDYKRALSTLAQSQDDKAVLWLKRSLADDAEYLPALDRLVDVLTRSHRYAEVAALSNDHPVTHDLKESTAILMAEANSQVGHPDTGTLILEAELKFQAPSPRLYLSLSKLYQADGDLSKAAEFKRRAEALKN